MTGKPDTGDAKDKESGALIGDLESIRTLLDDEEQAGITASAGGDSSTGNDVPMLDDKVAIAAEPDQHPGALTEDLFDSLLSDGWKSQADAVLEGARQTIDDQAQQWTPDDTDDLNEALRVRIDDTIYQWLQTMLADHIDELRAQVLDALSDEIKLRVKDALATAKKE